jgi:ribosomal protein S18 acetylase RimI-like enzyme
VQATRYPPAPKPKRSQENMSYTIRQMKIGDYTRVYALWKETEELSLEESDSKESLGIYLRRNRGFCFVACDGDQIIGTILCGHEGRRGILRHLAVGRNCRHRGIARALIKQCLSALARAGIRKCNTFVLDGNEEGKRFWENMGWYGLEDNYRTLQTPTVKGKGCCEKISCTGSAKKRAPGALRG